MDHSTSTTASRPVTLALIDPAGGLSAVQAELRYDSADPYAVTTVFMTPGSQVRWTFGRDLLGEGLFEPAGDGDVHVWPCLDADGNAVVIIELCSPDGEALVQARTGDLSAFVSQTTSIVPIGSESKHVNVDAAITALFATRLPEAPFGGFST